jgi:hypothetical protein
MEKIVIRHKMKVMGLVVGVQREADDIVMFNRLCPRLVMVVGCDATFGEERIRSGCDIQIHLGERFDPYEPSVVQAVSYENKTMRPCQKTHEGLPCAQGAIDRRSIHSIKHKQGLNAMIRGGCGQDEEREGKRKKKKKVTKTRKRTESEFEPKIKSRFWLKFFFSPLYTFPF